MEYVIKGGLEDRLKRIERKIVLLTYLTFGMFFSLRTEKRWAKQLFLFADVLLLIDTLSDLIKEFRYKLTHRKNV